MHALLVLDVASSTKAVYPLPFLAQGSSLGSVPWLTGLLAECGNSPSKSLAPCYSGLLAVSWQLNPTSTIQPTPLTMYNHSDSEWVMSSHAHGYNYEPQYSEGPAHEVAPFSRVSIAQHSEGMGHGGTAPLSRTPVKRMRGDTRQAHEGGHPTNA